MSKRHHTCKHDKYLDRGAAAATFILIVLVGIELND
jgi:hypothetical protein